MGAKTGRLCQKKRKTECENGKNESYCFKKNVAEDGERETSEAQ